jgi:hypothetical protein
VEPTKEEILRAYVTLTKILEAYGPDDVDDFHRQVVPDVLKLLDKLSR